MSRVTQLPKYIIFLRKGFPQENIKKWLFWGFAKEGGGSLLFYFFSHTFSITFYYYQRFVSAQDSVFDSQI